MLVDVSEMRMWRMWLRQRLLHHLPSFKPPLKTKLHQQGQCFSSKTTLNTFIGLTNDRQLCFNQTTMLRGLKGCGFIIMDAQFPVFCL